MRIQFLGATGTVTGSKTLIESAEARLLVDCGLYQGLKQLRVRNWKRPPIDLESLDAIVVSHAHIDHTGYLPLLVREGFRGPIYCTQPTEALCRILLPDSGRIHEEDAAYANRKKFSKHRPALPLYTEDDAHRALKQLSSTDFGETLQIGDLTVEFRPAGHILGAATVEVAERGRRLLFSGDLGRSDDLLMYPPEPPNAPDWLVIESTYGDRTHRKIDPVAEIADVLNRTLSREGTLLIPSFAVGRAQMMLLCLHEAFRRGIAPRVPVYVNSPMATSVTHLYQRFSRYHRLSPELCEEVFGLAHYVQSVEESIDLTERGRMPAVIISASGMATGGRVLHHLKSLAPDPRNTILFPGFQAPGTRGDVIAGGASSAKIHGAQVPIRAEVVLADIVSAHADRDMLLAWLGSGSRLPERVFVTHGDPRPADRLRHAIEEEFEVPALVPEYQEDFALGG